MCEEQDVVIYHWAGLVVCIVYKWGVDEAIEHGHDHLLDLRGDYYLGWASSVASTLMSLGSRMWILFL